MTVIMTIVRSCEREGDVREPRVLQIPSHGHILGDLSDADHCEMEGTELVDVCHLNVPGGPDTIVLCPKCGRAYRLPSGRQLERLGAFHLHGVLSQLGHADCAERALRFCKGPMGAGFAQAFED